MSCYTCVPQGTIQVVQQWGKFKKFADPGCHCLIPCCGDEIAGALSTRIQYTPLPKPDTPNVAPPHLEP